MSNTPPASAAIEIDADRRRQHHRWLLELTGTPTVAGREGRVVRWIERWVAQRPELTLRRDRHGNLVVRRTEPFASDAPVYITAHLDHPGFVVEAVEDDQRLVLAFRGGVMEDYFAGASVAVHTLDDPHAPARTGRVLERVMPPQGEDEPFKRYRIELDQGQRTEGIGRGDFATWGLPAAEVIDGVLHAPACDDLAAAAAALAALDELLDRHARGDTPAHAVGRDVRLLFTRAEEIGFIGAMGACREQTMQPESTVIALENSRAFDDSPIGGGPIVRVGDRLTVFTPKVTAAVASRAEAVAGGPAQPTAAQKHREMPRWRWQRKLMAGGACEATVFCAAGYDATCVCLPLGNYHNMGDLAAVQAGAGTPAIERERIAIADFDGLVDLLVACGQELRPGGAIADRLDRLWHERAGVLGEAIGGGSGG